MYCPGSIASLCPNLSQARLLLLVILLRNAHGVLSLLLPDTPQLLEPVVYGASYESMREKKERRKFHEWSSNVWADIHYGILNEEYEWSPLQRCEMFRDLRRRRQDGKLIPAILPPEVQSAWTWYRLMAGLFVLFSAIVFLPVLAVVGIISLVHAFYRDIDGEVLYDSRFSAGRHELTVFRIQEYLRYVYCFLESAC